MLSAVKKGSDCADIKNRRRLSPLQRGRRAPHPPHQTGPVLRIHAIGHQGIIYAEAFGQLLLQGHTQPHTQPNH